MLCERGKDDARRLRVVRAAFLLPAFTRFRSERGAARDGRGHPGGEAVGELAEPAGRRVGVGESFAGTRGVAVEGGCRSEIVERVGSGGTGEACGVKVADGARSARTQSQH